LHPLTPSSAAYNAAHLVYTGRFRAAEQGARHTTARRQFGATTLLHYTPNTLCHSLAYHLPARRACLTYHCPSRTIYFARRRVATPYFRLPFGRRTHCARHCCPIAETLLFPLFTQDIAMLYRETDVHHHKVLPVPTLPMPVASRGRRGSFQVRMLLNTVVAATRDIALRAWRPNAGP